MFSSQARIFLFLFNIPKLRVSRSPRRRPCNPPKSLSLTNSPPQTHLMRAKCRHRNQYGIVFVGFQKGPLEVRKSAINKATRSLPSRGSRPSAGGLVRPTIPYRCANLRTYIWWQGTRFAPGAGVALELRALCMTSTAAMCCNTTRTHSTPRSASLNDPPRRAAGWGSYTVAHRV